jgi:predicted TIM-barrel fold metal-dependent hydrolase
MWCNDYPHADGIWPHSEESIRAHMQGVSGADRYAILAGNAIRVYGL